MICVFAQLSGIMSVEDRINLESIFSYARACIEVARTFDQLGHEGYRRAIVPSRGASPIEGGAKSYFWSVMHSAVKGRARLDLHLQHISGPLCTPLYLPFTADSCKEMESIHSHQIRRFYAKVVAAIVRGDLTDPHYRFASYVRDSVYRIGFKSSIEDQVRSGRFVFLDTVVSGQAICEIIDAFEAEGLNECHYVLVVDADGSRMKSEYRVRLKCLEALGRAKLIKVPSLFTEDEGPAASGIWCLSCPELMSTAREEIPAFRHGAVGGGVYYCEVRKRDDASNLAVTLGSGAIHRFLWRAVQIVADPETVMKDLDERGHLDNSFDPDLISRRAECLLPWFEDEIEQYLEECRQFRSFDQATTRRIAEPRVRQATVGSPRLDVSSSHCLRLHYSRDEAARLVRDFRRTFG